MRKTIMVCIGILLFVAGYYQTRRQAQYTAARTTLSDPIPTAPSSGATDVKHTFAFRLVKPS